MARSGLSRQDLASALGSPVADVITLQGTHLNPEHLDFLGLMQARERNQPVPDAVVLHEGQPLLYLWDWRNQAVSDDAEIRRAMGKLALRSDAPYVAILRPGAVQVFALASVRERAEPLMQFDELDPGLMARLAVGDVPNRKDGYSTHQLMLELLKAVTEELIGQRGVLPAEALALVGRALFFRFLYDRGLLPPNKPMPDVSAFQDCFATPSNAAASCRWLDETFNGDLLELPNDGGEAYFMRLAKARGGGSALQDLSAIIRGDKPVGDGAYQTQFSWADLHFSYIPVGLLSQVYEEYAHRFEKDAAKEDSVYYTPRHLAEYVVDHAMSMLGPSAHLARVMDPATGGSVFLLAAFRRLVQAQWRATGVQPDTKTIRRILNTQLVGIDINPAARQLSALALYLTALELDPNVSQLKNLKFKALQGSVLLAAEEWEDQVSELNLGSLSLPIPSDLQGGFDLVVGNPPWTAVKGKLAQKAMDSISRSAMIDRGIEPARNPDGVPDMPFLWQATRWAKPGAVIAFAVHGRLLTKTTEQGLQARRALFQGLDVSYVLNGLELRNTPVWPNMAAHFCLLFAHNRPAGEDSRFYAVTPVEDKGLNREGRVRIDSKDAWTSAPGMVTMIPHLFKTLAKGNALDIELLSRVLGGPESMRQSPDIQRVRRPLADYLAQWKLAHGHGYQTASNKEDASLMLGLPEMPAPPEAQWLVVPAKDLPKFSRPFLHRTRLKEHIYEAPLVLLREAPSTNPNCPLAMLAFEKVVYRESYNGYSLRGAPDPEQLAVYLLAIFNSSLFLYYVLMTSSKLGCERSTFQKDEADRFPIVPLEALSLDQIQLLKAWEGLLRQPHTSEIPVDELIADIYQLRPADNELIHDRLAVAMPFAAVRKRAMAPPRNEEVDAFCLTLQNLLLPFDVSESPLEIRSYPQSPISPWRFLRIGNASSASSPSMQQLLTSVSLADSLDSSLVECVDGDAMFVGVLNQRRYWTRTAARTLALDLIKRNHQILARGYPAGPLSESVTKPRHSTNRPER